MFASVNFASYTEGWIFSFIPRVSVGVLSILSVASALSVCGGVVALRRLDAIRCEDKSSSLITVIRPGKRLGVYHFFVKLHSSLHVKLSLGRMRA